MKWEYAAKYLIKGVFKMNSKPIANYESYLIYENGDVKNLNTNKMLKGSISENGYRYYRLSLNNEKKMFYAHRLVAEHFLENPNNLPVVNHKDGNKLNNEVSNLEWVSYSDNAQHAHTMGLVKQSNQTPILYTEDLEGEEWKQYLDFSNYLISNKGRVRNIITNRLLKPSLASGYLKVRLCKDGKTKDLFIHKMVYALWNNEPYLEGRVMIIDHIDANKTNNCIENLRKISKSENTLAAMYEQGVNPSAKPVEQYSLDGQLLGTFRSVAEAARQLGLDSSTISKVCRGVNKTHGGFIFKYI